jgi:cell division septum initiation protein DivIVA
VQDLDGYQEQIDEFRQKFMKSCASNYENFTKKKVDVEAKLADLSEELDNKAVEIDQSIPLLLQDK